MINLESYKAGVLVEPCTSASSSPKSEYRPHVQTCQGMFLGRNLITGAHSLYSDGHRDENRECLAQ